MIESLNVFYYGSYSKRPSFYFLVIWELSALKNGISGFFPALFKRAGSDFKRIHGYICVHMYPMCTYMYPVKRVTVTLRIILL